jgi:hypothetical protein
MRTTAAMRAQTQHQGRYLGGRPPYGYRLVDAGPHPNAAHAQWGRRLRTLEADPSTAPYVRWMFRQRLAGSSVAGIARRLNEMTVPAPSTVDPGRNPHRSNRSWSLRTVAAILANPRYTGRQVWNRQSADHHTRRPPGRTGRAPARDWNRTPHWVVSTKPAHRALISEHDFVTAQAITALAAPADGGARTYQLVGLLRCRQCGRRLESHWTHGRAGYRCRHGRTSAQLSTDTAKIVYVREDHLLAAFQHITENTEHADLAPTFAATTRQLHATIANTLSTTIGSGY